MMRWMTWAVLFAATGCGGSQHDRGPAFCESYENNYLGTCNMRCVNDLEIGDEEGREACKKQCKQDLKQDDTFSDDCPGRADRL